MTPPDLVDAARKPVPVPTGRLGRHAQQLIGDLRHRRNHDHRRPRPRRLEPHDPDQPPNGIGVSDRRSAELHHDVSHGSCYPLFRLDTARRHLGTHLGTLHPGTSAPWHPGTLSPASLRRPSSPRSGSPRRRRRARCCARARAAWCQDRAGAQAADGDRHPVVALDVEARLRTVAPVQVHDRRGRRGRQPQLLRPSPNDSSAARTSESDGFCVNSIDTASVCPSTTGTRVVVALTVTGCGVTRVALERAEDFLRLALHLLFFAGDERDDVAEDVERRRRPDSPRPTPPAASSPSRARARTGAAARARSTARWSSSSGW